MNIEIRKIEGNDIPSLKVVLDTIELFPSDLLEEMIANFLNNNETEEIWFTALSTNTPIAIGYCSPEKLTDGTFNLYAIGVKKEFQGNGVGKQMMEYLEDKLRKNGKRVLIVETSGTDDFALTRKFYENLGYQKEAVIRDFWNEGDDKIIYWKKLN